MPNIYGPHIKAVREQKGIKARYVAARLRVSPPTYSEIESGQRGLSAERLRVIVRALDITLDDIDRLAYGGTEQANSKSKPGYGREGKLRAV